MRDFEGNFYCGVEDDAIIVRHVDNEPYAHRPQDLQIKFMRTIRVPDNTGTSKLPPSIGAFPLFKVRDYADRLPREMAAKGGVFFPMWQKEAMWIRFNATAPFMIKIYAGGVNVVSGEHRSEDSETKARRLNRIANGGNVQDYVVAPRQPWIDGIVISPGVVRQFVAMPTGRGYTVEAQLTGEEAVGGLQFEITPTFPHRRRKVEGPHPEKNFCIFIKTLAGKMLTMPCSPSDRVVNIKSGIRDMLGYPLDQQRLLFREQLDDNKTLAEYRIKNEETLHVALYLRGGGGGGGGGPQEDDPLGIAAGGKIEQVIRADAVAPADWIKDVTMTIPVHMLNTATFRHVTGQASPPCPVNASTYAEAGLPFFDMYDEPSGIAGAFDALKSVHEVEKAQGIVGGSEASVHPPLVKLNGHGQGITVPNRLVLLAVRDPDALLDPAGPLREFRTLADLEEELEDEFEDEMKKGNAKIPLAWKGKWKEWKATRPCPFPCLRD
ncbi:hypothetical protein F4779DRAFT_640343 [Xylariaceae sp. FL0662B]|nr:hypothetical protein F4779DRAFT_640343 [Xylariaceae sp. FL0662B]